MPGTDSLTALPARSLHSTHLDRLGVTLADGGGTLRVWSAHADGIELVLFDDTDLD
jgi:glycogen debranching enzyme